MSADPYGPYVTDGGWCLLYPNVPAVPGVAPRIERRAVLGWDAGANSIKTVDGDLHVVFDMPSPTTAAVIGIRSGRARPTLPSLIEHGLIFQKVGVSNMVQVMERGVAVGDPTPRSLDDVFEIRRVRGQVTYLRNGTPLRTSSASSAGPKIVTACLYASGDKVGS